METAPAPLPNGIEPAAIAAQPVPPLLTDSTPVMSEARLTKAVETAPAVAFKKPASEPIVSEGVDRAPVLLIEVVPVEPNAAVLARELPENEVVDVAYVVVEFVVVNPPLKARAVVVALPGNGYAKELVTRHAPFTMMQPLTRVMPLANVEVAVPVCAKLRTDNPPENVDVADEKFAIAPIENFVPGDDVAIPKLPLESIVSAGVVDVA